MNRRMLRTVILCTPVPAAVALPGSVTAPVGATGPAIPPNYDVSARHGNEAEDAIAINPTNPSNIVAVSMLPGVVSAALGWRARSCQP
jgi:hypothetical protein